MRCAGLSSLGNQCQNNAGKDGLCRNHRGAPVRNGAPKEILVCFACRDTLKVHRGTEKRNFDEKPGYYLCNVCVKTYKHERPENTVLIHHGALGRFSAFTVRKPDPEEADAVLRAKALLAQVSWPGGYGDA